jgi:ribosome silencing factor RsfS/YbeB/iojap
MSTTPVTPHSLDLPPEVARAAEHLFDRKAQDVTLLDLRGISTATDFFLIATGTSDTHVAAISDHVVEELRAEGTRPLNVEGRARRPMGADRLLLVRRARLPPGRARVLPARAPLGRRAHARAGAGEGATA